MDREEKPALELCPFCGSDMESFAGMHPDAFAKGPETFAVNCDRCGAVGPFVSTMEQAVAEWNSRWRAVLAKGRLRGEAT